MHEETEGTPVEVPTRIEQLTKGEILSQVDIAKRYPRSLKEFRQRAMTMATLNEDIARSCFYVLSRDGKKIEGPSVRLAEICASAYKNMRYGARPTLEEGRFVTSQGFAFDLENNVAVTIEVKRRITKRDGSRYGDDMIMVATNAASSIALRGAVFKVIPAALIQEVYEEVKRVAVGDAKTLADRRQKMMLAFTGLGVKPEQVLALVEKPSLEDVGLTEIETLIGTFNAIRDGETSVDDVFGPKTAPVGMPKSQAETAAEKASGGQATTETPPPAAASLPGPGPAGPGQPVGMPPAAEAPALSKPTGTNGKSRRQECWTLLCAAAKKQQKGAPALLAELMKHSSLSELNDPEIETLVGKLKGM